MAKDKDSESKMYEIAKNNLKNFLRPASEIDNPEFVSTGHLKLDLAVAHGIDPEDEVELEKLESSGGFPMGKLIEVFGPEGSGKSSLAYRVVGYAQRKGYKAAWIDTEQSFSPTLAEINGVERDKLSIADLKDLENPNHLYSAEEIFDRICDICMAGYKVIVLDSVANLTTRAELENYLSEGGVGMGALAQVMSKSLKKVVNYAAKYGVMVIMINQIREKIGVMYGCFHEDTLVKFADGRTIPIRTVVEEKLTGPVLTYDLKTKEIKTAEITDWHNNGLLDEDQKWLHFLCEGPGTKNGRLGFTCTENHVLINSLGEEISAENVIVGDELMTYREEKILLDNVHRDIIYGSLLGDGHIALRSDHTASIKFSNSDLKQQGYVNWKMKNLPMLKFSLVESSGRKSWHSDYSVELKTLKDLFYDQSKGYRQIPDDLILTDLMAAIWYQDDGNLKITDFMHSIVNATISIKRLANNPVQTDRAVKLFERWKPELVDHVKYSSSQKALYFDSEGTKTLLEHTAVYAHPDLFYKYNTWREDRHEKHLVDLRHLEWSKYYEKLAPKIYDARLVPYPAKVLSKDIASNRMHRSKTKYDISIGGDGTYMVGGGTGIVVHNSPETTPGGRALKFLASVRVRIQKQTGEKGAIEQDRETENGLIKETIGGNAYVSIPKNRFGKPIRNSLSIPVYYVKYFPGIEDIIFNEGRRLKVIGKHLKLYRWNDVREEGREAFIKKVKELNLIMPLIEEIKKSALENKDVLAPEILYYDSDEAEIISASNTEETQDGTTKENTEVRRGRKRKDSKDS